MRLLLRNAEAPDHTCNGNQQPSLTEIYVKIIGTFMNEITVIRSYFRVEPTKKEETFLEQAY